MSSPASFLRLTFPLASINVLNQASRVLRATIGPALALEFGLSAAELGLLAASFFASYAVAQLPVGLAGVRRVQTVLALVAGSGFLLCALSTGIVGLAVGRIVAGLGLSVGMIAMLTAHTQWLPRHRVAGMTGLAALASVWIAFSVPERPTSTTPKRGLRAEIVEYLHIARPPPLRFYRVTYGALWAGPWLRDVGGYEGTARAALLMCFAAGMMGGSLLIANPWPSAGPIGTLMNFTMLVTVFVLQNVIGWILDLWPRTASGGWSVTGYGWAMGLTVVAQACAVVWALIPRRA